jgi:hypothetical protein
LYQVNRTRAKPTFQSFPGQNHGYSLFIKVNIFKKIVWKHILPTNEGDDSLFSYCTWEQRSNDRQTSNQCVGLEAIGSSNVEEVVPGATRGGMVSSSLRLRIHSATRYTDMPVNKGFTKVSWPFQKRYVLGIPRFGLGGMFWQMPDFSGGPRCVKGVCPLIHCLLYPAFKPSGLTVWYVFPWSACWKGVPRIPVRALRTPTSDSIWNVLCKFQQ